MKRLLPVVSLTCLLFTSISSLHSQWMPTNGPYRDEITTVLACDSVLYLGTPLNGIFRSSDGGFSWRAASQGLRSVGTCGLAAVGDTLFAGVELGGVFTSIDRGEHWTRLLPTDIYRGDYLGVHDGRVFVGAGGVLWMSTNRGATWTGIGPSAYPLPDFIRAMATFGSRLVVGADNGFAVSSDLGETWSRGDSGIAHGQDGIRVASLFRVGTTLFAGTNCGAYVSQDSARTWTVLDSIFLTRRVTGWAIIDSTVFAGTDTAGVYRRQGLRGTWSKLSPGPAAGGILNLTVQGRTLYAGTEDGLFVSTDQGEHWAAHWLDIHRVETSLLVAASTGTSPEMLFAASEVTLYRSTNQGESWERAYTGLPGRTKITGIVHDGAAWYASASENGVYRSLDGGMTWQAAGPAQPPAGVNTLAVVGGTVIAGTPAGIYRLPEGAGEWTRPDSGLGAEDVRALVTLHDTIVAGAGYQGFTYISTDKGAHWRSTGPGWGTYRSTKFAVRGSILFACTFLPPSDTPYPVDGAIFRSFDYGASWTRVDKPGMGMPVTIAADSTGLYVGNWARVFYSTNFGGFWSTWEKPPDSLPRMSYVGALAVSGKYLFAGGDVGGVYRRLLPQFVAGTGKGIEEIPRRLALHQNYPNPFNPVTTIRYAVATRSHVTITVFNTLGQKVGCLVNEEVGAGEHSVRFDAAGLASGVYFYQLRAEGRMLTHSMVLMK